MVESQRKIKKTLIMGILNITPDSFSDGGELYNNVKKALRRTKEMIAQGANIIDIGGESTRPGSSSVSAQEEIQRILPVIQLIRKEMGNDIVLSADTNKATVAQQALLAGVNMINTMGGFIFDEDLIQIVAKHKCRVVIYHIKGIPKTMQKGDISYNNITDEISYFFNDQITRGINNGIERSQFILDPGIGFGKTIEQNLHIIKHLYDFHTFSLPIAIGVSRKSHIGMILKDSAELPSLPPPKERLWGSLAETAVAVMNGVTIVRTHDVQATRDFLSVLDRIRFYEA